MEKRLGRVSGLFFNFLLIPQNGKRRKPVWLWLKLLIFIPSHFDIGAGGIAWYEAVIKIINTAADFFLL